MSLTCEDPYDEHQWIVPGVKYVEEDDKILPNPPKGWAIAFTLPNKPYEEYGSDADAMIAFWILVVEEAQAITRQVHGGHRRHMIGRNSDGERVLLVHPDYAQDFSDMIDWANGKLNGDCNCGLACLDKPIQTPKNLALPYQQQKTLQSEITKKKFRQYWRDIGEDNRKELVDYLKEVSEDDLPNITVDMILSDDNDLRGYALHCMWSGEFMD